MFQLQIRPMLQSMRTLATKRKNALLLVGLILALLLATGFAYARKTVHIIADGNTVMLSTFQTSPVNVLNQAGIRLGEQDEYRLSTQGLVDGTTIEVFRAVPVSVTFGGQTRTVITGKPTVGEVLQALNYTAPDLQAVPDADAPVLTGMNIRVIKVKEILSEKEEPIEYPVVREPDPTLEFGLEQVEQEGEDGLRKVTYRIRYEDGKEVSSAIVQENILKPAVPAKVRAGSRETVDTSRGSLRFRQAMLMEATAYLPTDGDGRGITYSGRPARYGVIAVDPNVIAIGTRVFIPGYGVAVAADTGGDIKGDRVDLCMEDYHEAWGFGRRMVKVYILAE